MAPDPAQAGGEPVRRLLHQNQPIKRGAGGEGDCDIDVTLTARDPHDRPVTELV